MSTCVQPSGCGDLCVSACSSVSVSSCLPASNHLAVGFYASPPVVLSLSPHVYLRPTIWLWGSMRLRLQFCLCLVMSTCVQPSGCGVLCVSACSSVSVSSCLPASNHLAVGIYASPPAVLSLSPHVYLRPT